MENIEKKNDQEIEPTKAFTKTGRNRPFYKL